MGRFVLLNLGTQEMHERIAVFFYAVNFQRVRHGKIFGLVCLQDNNAVGGQQTGLGYIF